MKDQTLWNGSPVASLLIEMTENIDNLHLLSWYADDYLTDDTPEYWDNYQRDRQLSDDEMRVIKYRAGRIRRFVEDYLYQLDQLTQE